MSGSAPSPLSQPSTWDLVAPGYVDVLLPSFTEYALDALTAVAPAPQARVLDVATGPGTLPLLAAPRVREVVAVDFAPDMLARARSHVAARALTNVTFHLSDGQRLPFDGGSFDAAFSLFGLIFFPDRGAGLRELHRVVRPGGRVALTSWLPFSESPVLNAIFTAVGKHLEMPFGRSGPPPLGSRESIAQELSDASFESIEVTRIEHAITAPSLAAYWHDMVRSSAPLTLLHKQMPAERWPAFEAAVLNDLAANFGKGPLTVPAPAWLTVAHRPA